MQRQVLRKKRDLYRLSKGRRAGIGREKYRECRTLDKCLIIATEGTIIHFFQQNVTGRPQEFCP